MNIFDLLSRPIAYHRCFISLGAGVTGAVFMSQAVYWTRRTNDPDGWFYKSQMDWEEETGLKRGEQEKARKMLVSVGVLEERKKGLPAKLFYRVNEAKLTTMIAGTVSTQTVEDVLLMFQSTLNGMSKAGMMRAAKMGITAEYVDYSEVLKDHGLTCSCCGKKIEFGPGKGDDCLSFDHITPIAVGGHHSRENIRPAHVGCVAIKNESFEADLSDLDEANKLAETNDHKLADSKQTCTLTQSEPARLDQAIILTENTTETTAEITTETTNNTDVEKSVPSLLSKQKQPKQDQNGLLGDLPDWVPSDSWIAFVEMRQAMGQRGKLTARAAKMIINELKTFRDQGQDVGAILDKSTMNNWKGVFPIKQQYAGKQQALEDRNRAAADDFLNGGGWHG